MIERIEEKILAIRKEPESVRMRYLFICLGVSMIFVIIIWLFSLKDMATNFSNTNLDNHLPALDLNEGVKSLESLGEQPLGTTPKGGSEMGGNPLLEDPQMMNK